LEAKKTKIFINCAEAKQICDKAQYNEATWWERFRLGIRLLYCGVTQQYVKQNKKLTQLVKTKDVVCMSKKCKAELKDNFQEKLQKKPQE